ncbi:MAG TPA: sigma 54-interacting transcriptional regulator [Candidatus Acidoferrum sp.]|nr:sigma 54-interacting transcriptional regulator [Candidatus Acidoferrum sp.]
MSLADVDEVIIGRGEERQWSRVNRQLTVAIPDVEISRLHVRLVRRGESWTLQDVGSKNGTLVGGIRTERCTLADRDIIEIGGSLFVYRDRADHDADPGDRDLAAESPIPDVFRTLSLDLERRAAELVRIAPTPVPVLIVGETGTGKELVAEAVHSLSQRRGAFVPVNCGALPRTLVESELFGYRRGAFSGAREDRMGLARKADGGTLFLDEVAELPEESQVALLRLLQEGEVRPIGSADLVKVDVRVIAATHQDLSSRIADGRFRRDLYGRVAGYEMAMPALRDRPEDIGSLIAVLLRRIGIDDPAFSLHPRAAFALFAYSYPMNVRELEQALRAAVALASDNQIGLQHLPQAMRGPQEAARAHLGPEDLALRAKLVEILRQTNGNISATARALDRAPVQIRRWCRRLGIYLAEFRR